MKTEVVLKFVVFSIQVALFWFNENRSCIEIVIRASDLTLDPCLMKTEVVLKFY